MAESKLTKIGYELEDVNIIQAPISYIEHRSECDPMIEMCGRKVYPVIVAPMGAVTDENNYKTWLENGFICVVPRTVDYDKRVKISSETFASFSLSEAKTLHKDITDGKTHYICIDIAHGSMYALYDVCYKLKDRFKDKIVIITGNIAVPEAYNYYANNRIDFMRACIGTGSRCVVEGTKVMMADGSFETIENILPGDFVKTSTGTNKVLKSFSRETRSTVKINDSIECTDDHKFFVVKKSDVDKITSDEDILKYGFYIQASHLTEEYLLVQA